MLYDWANSALSAIVAAIVLPIYFKEMAQMGGVDSVDAKDFLILAVLIDTALLVLAAPKDMGKFQ